MIRAEPPGRLSFSFVFSSSATLRASLYETGDASTRLPIGRVLNRGDELPRSVDFGDGSGANTGRKLEGVISVGLTELFGGTRIVVVDGSGVDVIRTSCQPFAVFCAWVWYVVVEFESEHAHLN